MRKFLIMIGMVASLLACEKVPVYTCVDGIAYKEENGIKIKVVQYGEELECLDNNAQSVEADENPNMKKEKIG